MKLWLAGLMENDRLTPFNCTHILIFTHICDKFPFFLTHILTL